MRDDVEKSPLFRRLWFPILAAITLIGLIVPMSPVMPSGGLDPSWTMSMNEATARHMRIGHDAILTVGPYAAVYTETYHPALDHLMLFSALIFALCYLGAFLYVVKGRAQVVGVILLVFLGWFMQSRDALLFSYPLLLALCAVKFSAEQEIDSGRSKGWVVPVAAALCVPLGVLPLVKGNMIVLCSLMVALIAGYLLYRRHAALAAVTVVIPMASLLVFWMIVGQPLAGLADYAGSSVQILSGYTEAMGMRRQFRGLMGYLPEAEILSYLAGACVVMWCLLRVRPIGGLTKIFLGVCFALYLFMGFKSGFVRHDAHALIASNCLIFAILLVGCLRWDRGVRTAFLLCALVFAGMMLRYSPPVLALAKAMIPNYKDNKADVTETSLVAPKKKVQSVPQIIRDAVLGVYGPLGHGLWERMSQQDELAKEYRQGLAELASAYPVHETGTTDIYPLAQAYVLASGAKWDPRPVFQSNAAWTPALALMNEEHLRTGDAPDHVLFQIDLQDELLPSLDDGVSWTALMDNYRMTGIDAAQIAHLDKREELRPHSDLRTLLSGTYKTGESVTVPIADGPVIAVVELEPTLFGKLVETVFKPTQVRLLLTLADGSRRDYRVLPNLMKTGMVLSPLVEDTDGFAKLISGDRGSLGHAVVKTMTLEPYRPTWRIWADQYTLKLEEYRGGAWSGEDAEKKPSEMKVP